SFVPPYTRSTCPERILCQPYRGVSSHLSGHTAAQRSHILHVDTAKPAGLCWYLEYCDALLDQAAWRAVRDAVRCRGRAGFFCFFPASRLRRRRSMRSTTAPSCGSVGGAIAVFLPLSLALMTRMRLVR